MSSFAVYTTEPTDLDSLFVDQLRVQDCLQMPIKDATQVSTSACGLGAILYQNDTDEVKARMATGWEALATAGSVPSVSGLEGAIQLSDGSGGLTNDPYMYVESSVSVNPISRLNVDASNTPAPFEPNARLRIVPPTAATTALTVPALDGDIAYFEDPLLSGKDLYFFNGINWVSLTGTGAPSTAAGPQYSVQVNATGGATPQLGGSADFLFDTSGGSNVVTLNANSTVTGTTLLAGDTNITSLTTIAQFDAANGIQMQTAAVASGIDLLSLGTAPMSLTTASGDLALTANAGDITATTAQGVIALTATGGGPQPASASLTAGSGSAELLTDAASFQSTLQLSNTTTGNPATVPWFSTGMRVASAAGQAGYDTGSGAALYLEGIAGLNNPRQATFELRSRDVTTPPFVPVTRIFAQASSLAFNGGYRALYAASYANRPTPDDLGDGTPLRTDEFYIGEGKIADRPHFSYYLGPGSGFGNFNICNSTLTIADHTEVEQYVKINESGGIGQAKFGELGGGAVTDQVEILGSGIINVGINDNIIIDASGAAPIIDVGAASGGGWPGGIWASNDNGGTSIRSAVLTAAASGAGTDGQLRLYPGAVNPSATNHTLIASGNSGGSLALGTSSAAPTITMTGGNGQSFFRGDMEVQSELSLTDNGSTAVCLELIPSDIPANRSFSLSNRQGAGLEFGSEINFKGSVGTSGVEQAGIRFSPYNNVFTTGFSLVDLGNTGEGCSMILDANTQGGNQAGQGGGLYLGWNENTIFNNASWPGLKARNYGGNRPCLLVNGPTLFAQDSSSRLFSWDHNTSTEEKVWIGYGGASAGLHVQGDLSVSGTKSFAIDHPDPKKKDTHSLYHNAVETPTCGDNLYRYRVETKEKKAVIDLPEYFQYLNVDEMTWVSPVASFGRGYAVVSTDQTRVDVTVDEDGKYNILIIATRKDESSRRWKGVEREKK